MRFRRAVFFRGRGSVFVRRRRAFRAAVGAAVFRLFFLAEHRADLFDVVDFVAAFSESDGRYLSRNERNDTAESVFEIDRAGFFEGAAVRSCHVEELRRTVFVDECRAVTALREGRKVDQGKIDGEFPRVCFRGRKGGNFFSVRRKPRRQLFEHAKFFDIEIHFSPRASGFKANICFHYKIYSFTEITRTWRFVPKFGDFPAAAIRLLSPAPRACTARIGRLSAAARLSGLLPQIPEKIKCRQKVYFSENMFYNIRQERFLRQENRA